MVVELISIRGYDFLTSTSSSASLHVPLEIMVDIYHHIVGSYLVKYFSEVSNASTITKASKLHSSLVLVRKQTYDATGAIIHEATVFIARPRFSTTSSSVIVRDVHGRCLAATIKLASNESIVINFDHASITTGLPLLNTMEIFSRPKRTTISVTRHPSLIGASSPKAKMTWGCYASFDLFEQPISSR